MWYHRVSDSMRQTIFACVGESGCEMPAAKACMIGVETRSGLDKAACSRTRSVRKCAHAGSAFTNTLQIDNC
jgi:hypothetical protein